MRVSSWYLPENTNPPGRTTHANVNQERKIEHKTLGSELKSYVPPTQHQGGYNRAPTYDANWMLEWVRISLQQNTVLKCNICK